MRLRLVKSFVIRCGQCNAWYGRIPQWWGEDWGDKGDRCERCGCTSFTAKEGRPWGKRSAQWEKLFQEYFWMYDSFSDDRDSLKWFLSTIVIERSD